jgi:hypothetical protein
VYAFGGPGKKLGFRGSAWWNRGNHRPADGERHADPVDYGDSAAALTIALASLSVAVLGS